MQDFDKNDNSDISQQDIVSMPEAEVNVAKCPSCGASVSFDPSSQLLRCDYCNTTVDFDKSQANEKQSIQNLVKNRQGWDTVTKMYSCGGCGAIEVLSKTDIVKECPYCRSTNIVDISNLSGAKPDAVLPFIIDKNKAGLLAERWVSRKFFAPKSFKKNFVPENLRGVYNPSFVFDTDTFSKYNGKLGKHYTTTRTVNGKTVTQTHTRWFRVSGPHYDKFADVTIQASQKIKGQTMVKLSPFNVAQCSAYNDGYLQGFSANHYDKDGLTCWDEAKTLIDKSAYNNVLRSLRYKYNYDVVGNFKVETQCYNISYEYALLPIFVGHCKYKNRDYNYFVNGFTGKMTGNTPVSKGKVGLFVGIGVAILLGLAAGYFLF